MYILFINLINYISMCLCIITVTTILRLFSISSVVQCNHICMSFTRLRLLGNVVVITRKKCIRALDNV